MVNKKKKSKFFLLKICFGHYRSIFHQKMKEKKFHQKNDQNRPPPGGESEGGLVKGQGFSGFFFLASREFRGNPWDFLENPGIPGNGSGNPGKVPGIFWGVPGITYFILGQFWESFPESKDSRKFPEPFPGFPGSEKFRESSGNRN